VVCVFVVGSGSLPFWSPLALLRLVNGWQAGLRRSFSVLPLFAKSLARSLARVSGFSSLTTSSLEGTTTRSRCRTGVCSSRLWQSVALTSLHCQAHVASAASSQRLLSQIALNHLRYHTKTHLCNLALAAFAAHCTLHSGSYVEHPFHVHFHVQSSSLTAVP
jgi:hypothetical protein